MTDKTEDEIAREKEAVQKMIGAKGAMETALKRIDRLESVLRSVDLIATDIQRSVGEGLFVKTFYHGKSSSGEATVSLRDQMIYIKSQVSKNL